MPASDCCEKGITHSNGHPRSVRPVNISSSSPLLSTALSPFPSASVANADCVSPPCSGRGDKAPKAVESFVEEIFNGEGFLGAEDDDEICVALLLAVVDRAVGCSEEGRRSNARKGIL